MTVTKAHFELIARILRVLGTEGTRSFDSVDDRHAIAGLFADEFVRHNPRFDYERFMRAALPVETPTVQYTPETCPGKPCSSECDHVGIKPDAIDYSKPSACEQHSGPMSFDEKE